jgi:hypothetical protein
MMRIASSLARGAILLAVATAYLAGVFQWPARSFATSGPGDWLDPYFINGILEHWYWSITHVSDPASPIMYFPARGTLGYSHSLIGYAPFYILVRPFLHPFQAAALTLFLVILVGTVALYLTFRRLQLGFVEAMALVMFFLTSKNVINAASGHWSQQLSVFLFPPVILLALLAVSRRSSLLAGLAGCFAMLLFAQDFYPAVFAVMLTVLFLAGLLPLTRGWRLALANLASRLWASLTAVWRDVPASNQARPGRWWLVAAIGLSLWSLIVFVHPIDRFELGPLRLSARHPERPLWLAAGLSGWWVFRHWSVTRRLETLARHRRGVRQIASSLRTSEAFQFLSHLWDAHRAVALPMALGAVLGIVVFLWIYLRSYLEHPAFPSDQRMSQLTSIEPWAWRQLSDLWQLIKVYRSRRPFDAVLLVSALAWLPVFAVDRRTRLYIAWCAFISLIVLVMPLRIGELSLWTVIWHIPVMSVMRDPVRLIEMFELAVGLLLGIFLARLRARSILRMSVTGILCALMFLNWNRERFDFFRADRFFDQWVEPSIAVDRSCRSFFIKGASETYMKARPGHMWSLYGVDSWFIAMRYGIPTLNGYSAWVPETWQLANPQEASYIQRVQRWIGQNHLSGVCVLDIDARTMTPYMSAESAGASSR